MYRQGDVLLVPRKSVKPDQAVRAARDKGRVVLAYGKLTGHAHAIASKAATLWELGDARLLVVRRPVLLQHEEHATIQIPPGDYDVIQQCEYVAGEVRNVAD